MQGINLDVLRSEDENKGKKYQTGLFWSPPEGNSVVRIVPYVHKPGNPFTTILIHFNLIPNSRQPVLSPKTFGEKDPAFDFGMKIRETQQPDAVEQSKKYFPATKIYCPVIIRGKEADGIKFWGMSKTNYEDLKNLIINGGAGDIADLQNGRDVLINHSKIPGRTAGMIRVLTAPNPSVATTDSVLLEAIKNVPVIEELYDKPTQEKMLEYVKAKVEHERKLKETAPTPKVDSQTGSVGNYDLDKLLSDY